MKKNSYNAGKNNPMWGRTREKHPMWKIGKNHPNWRDGKKKDRYGYILIYSPNHPYNVQNYVYEHRLVVEKHLGRYLKLEEVVHHKNGNTSDNRIENLQLFKNNGYHLNYHKKLRRAEK